MLTNFISKFQYSPLGVGGMISVNEAKKIIRDNVEVMSSINLSLPEAVGYVLAEDVLSKIDFPPFNQSNVDGYAIAFKDENEKLIIAGESAAGNNQHNLLQSKQAMRIFTGAPVPANADTVVMQEKVAVADNILTVNDEELQQGLNFRAKGKDIKQLDIALCKDEYLSAGAIGYLSALGITEVSVYKKPSITIIITGNELQQPGKDLKYGEVYEANSFMLKSVLQQLHFYDVKVLFVDDNLKRLTSILNNVLIKIDVVLLCGGISVGDYDFVLQATTDCSVEKLFHKVKQRPGKPLYFGKKDKKIVFGLPGNPSSVLTCFYEYVVETLMLMMNKQNGVKITSAALTNDYKKIAGLTFFLKGLLQDDHTVVPLDAQESYRLSSYAKANSLIKLEEERTEYKKGEIVEVHVLPN